MKIPYTEIKHPLVHMKIGDFDDARTIWWEDADGNIHYFDDCPSNYPRWSLGTFDNKEEAVKRLKEMTESEGWEIIENNLEET